MANINISQILMKRGNTAAASTYTGPLGELLVDTGLHTIRIQDGVTPGGWILGAGGGTDLSGVNANIALLYANAGVQQSQINSLRANITAANLAIVSTNSAITTANTGMKSYVDAQLSTKATTSYVNTSITTANTAMKGYVDAQVATRTTTSYVNSAISTAIDNLINSAPGTLDTLGEIAANLANQGSAVGAIVSSITGLQSNAASQQTQINNLTANISNSNTANTGFIGDAIYNFNGPVLENADLSHGATAAVVVPGNGSTNPLQINNTYGPVTIGTGAGSGIDNIWQFETDGKLAVPQNRGVDINWTSDTAGGGPGDHHYDSLRINNDHIHGLYITNTMDGNPSTWLFGKDGNLTFPDSTVQTTAWTVYSQNTVPSNGLLWYNTDDGRTYLKYNGTWVDASPTVAPAPSYYLGNLTVDGDVVNFTNGNLTIDNAGNLLVNGNLVTGGSTYGNVNVAQYLNHLDTAITWTDGTNILIDSGLYLNSASAVGINSGEAAWVFNTNSTVSWPNNLTVGTSGGDALWTTPNATTIYANNGINLSTLGNDYTWTFNNTGVLTAPGDVNILGSFVNTTNGYLNLRGSSVGPTTRVHVRNSDSDPSSDVNIHLQTGGAGNIFELFQLSGGNTTRPFAGGLRTNSTSAPILIQTDSQVANNIWQFGVDGNLTLPSNSASINYANGHSILSGISGGSANTGDITFSGSDITGTGSNVTLTADTTDWVFYSNGATVFPDHGPVTMTGNLTVGNLFVNGNTTTINTQTYTVNDNIIQIADGNPADTLDIGFVGHRTVGGTLEHTGLVRNASINSWMLFSNVVPQVGSTVDFTNANYDTLIIGDLNAGNTTVYSVNFTGSPAASSSPGIQWINGFQDRRYGNVEVAAYLTAGISGNIKTSANVIAPNYLFANGVNILSTVGGGTYGNTQVAQYLPTYSGNIQSANIIQTNPGQITSPMGSNGNVVINPDGTGWLVTTAITPAWFGNSVTVAGTTSTGVFQSKQIRESFGNVTPSGNAFALDCSAGQIFNITMTNISSNFTANLTNLNLASGYVTTVSLLLNQGTTPYVPGTLQIGGTSTSFNWQGGSTPAGVANRKDVVAFNILNASGSYIVLAQLVSF